jgi:hypothetical protein
MKDSDMKQWIPAPANDSQTVNGAVLGAFGE